jgi:nucleotide-binding universal stress UspA family protein
MFKHLLVPLDGSSLAEAALPAAAFLAQTLGARVTLVHVIEQDAPQEIHGQRHLTDPDEACGYLDDVAGRAFPSGVLVERHVHSAAVDDVARSIVAHEAELAPDLIVMCTHGQSGLRTRLFGSVAQQIIGLGRTPVLLIQPEGEAAPLQFSCDHLLVPLDGDPDHEQGLVVAADLAAVHGARLHLVWVVPTLGTLPGQDSAAGWLLPGATSAVLDLAQDEAEAQLRDRVAQLQTRGLAVDAGVQRGDPAAIIVRTARRINADLVVLGTHGRSGQEAFWSESVAPQVIGRAHVPLLLVPVREPGSQPSRE